MNKYNIGETVFFMHENKVVASVVVCIRGYDYSKPLNKIIYEMPVPGLSSIGREQSLVFKTKEELIASL